MMNQLATMFGIGKSPRAPGTMGSLAAALLAYAVLQIPGGGWYVLLGGAVLFALLGTIAADQYMRHTGALHDPKEIVVDELAGQWITYAVWYLWIVGITSQGATLTSLEVEAAPQFLVIGFFLFRFFDILKPWPIRLADHHIKGGFGVMFDDVLAGFAAGSVLYAVYLCWPLFFGQLQEMP